MSIGREKGKSPEPGRSDFDALIESHGPSLFRCLISWVGDVALAEDLFQETFAAAYTHRSRFRPGGSVRAWLHRIAYNRALNALRDGSRVVADDAALMGAAEPARPACGAPEAHLLNAELRERIDEALEQLPGDRKTAVTMRDVEGRPYVEIASALGTTEAAARVRVHRARRQLQQILAPYLNDEPGRDGEAP